MNHHILNDEVIIRFEFARTWNIDLDDWESMQLANSHSNC